MLLLSRRKRLLAFVTIGQVSFVAGFTLFTAFVVGGSGYLIRELHRQVGVARSMLPVAQPEPEAPFLITEDMFHVTSIALGQPRLAVVNGIALGEGESLTIVAGNHIASVRVSGIADGTVTLKVGSQTLSAKLSGSVAKNAR